MKRFCFPAFLLLMNGCFACGTGSRNEEVDPGLKVYRPAAPPLDDRHTSRRLDLVAPGTWISYRVSKDGNETTITLGAVRAEGNSLWIEVVEEGDPKTVSLRRISFGGEVLEARYQEIPATGPPSEVADQPVSPGEAGDRSQPAQKIESKRKVKVGEREVEVLVIKNVYRDESVGREYEEEAAWTGEAPTILEFREIGGKPAGLVSRKSPTSSIHVVDWGTGYTPKIK
jgi:hypothetical protein